MERFQLWFLQPYSWERLDRLWKLFTRYKIMTQHLSDIYWWDLGSSSHECWQSCGCVSILSFPVVEQTFWDLGTWFVFPFLLPPLLHPSFIWPPFLDLHSSLSVHVFLFPCCFMWQRGNTASFFSPQDRLFCYRRQNFLSLSPWLHRTPPASFQVTWISTVFVKAAVKSIYLFGCGIILICPHMNFHQFQRAAH